MLMTAKATAVDLQAKLFRGFSDPSRLSILEALRDGPLTVSEIVEATGLSQSNVSNHLGCLRDCGLVVAEQEGRYVTYHLSDDRVAELLALAESLLADVARGVYECTRYNLPGRSKHG
ncbi:MAG: winged helix-turn-helix transcriptional regulator [Chloroflexi bacterium]|nr:winged helix-turn-helix transcriptional regulator [Chloroflexota bacterium]MBI4315136.1 winged helix-turn-helix transcriptional regulator [Chloroflexota bacterium]